MAKKEAKTDQPPAADEKKTCGLIMPISARDGLPETHWLEVRAIIEKSLSSLNLDVRLVSDGEASDVIHKTILQRLYTSTVCVCDISTLNPNVMFELGIRLRADLFAINPHCDNCAQRLQMMQPNRPDYAVVVCGRLSCLPCTRIVYALACVEGRCHR